MVTVKCFKCGKIIKPEYIRKRVRCPHCDSKILFKPRVVSTTMEAV